MIKSLTNELLRHFATKIDPVSTFITLPLPMECVYVMFSVAEDCYEDNISQDATYSSYEEEETFQQPLQILHRTDVNCHEATTNLSLYYAQIKSWRGSLDLNTQCNILISAFKNVFR